MITQLNSIFILFITLLLFSCNSPHQRKSILKESNTTDKIDLVNKNIAPVKYNSGDVVTKGYLDKLGNIWFTTTKDGIYKYDGKTFSHLTIKDGLCSNEVWSVIEDKKGLLWFATAKGLCSYDGKNFVNIPLPQEGAQNVSPETGFPSRKTELALTLIQDQKGNFWIGTNASGAYRYDGKTFTSFLKYKGRLHPEDSVYNNCITSITEDRKGNIWFTSITHGGISRYDGKSIVDFTTKDGLLGDMTNSSFEDKAGNIWFGSIQNLTGGLMFFDGKSFKSYTTEDGLCDSNVTSFYEDKLGNIWIGTGDGVCYYDGKTFTAFNNNGQSLGDIRFIIKDNEDNMWFGGRYGVLYRYDGNQIENFTNHKNK